MEIFYKNIVNHFYNTIWIWNSMLFTSKIHFSIFFSNTLNSAFLNFKDSHQLPFLPYLYQPLQQVYLYPVHTAPHRQREAYPHHKADSRNA